MVLYKKVCFTLNEHKQIQESVSLYKNKAEKNIGAI